MALVKIPMIVLLLFIFFALLCMPNLQYTVFVTLQLTNKLLGAQPGEVQKPKLSKDQIDALLYLVEEYRTACTLNPKFRAQSIIQFWKREYSQEALLHKARKGELNPHFVRDLLLGKGEFAEDRSYDMHMLRTLATMHEDQLTQVQ